MTSSVRQLYRGLLLISCAFAMNSLTVFAALAAPVVIPPSTQPGQVEKNFEAPAPLLRNPELHLPIPGEPGTSKEAQEKLAKVKFVLKSVEFNGATVYTAEDLEFSYKDMVGQKISLLDAQDIAHKVTALYHKDGYILSQAIVPPQDVTNGVLKVRVIEGYVGGVIVPEGAASESEREVIAGYAENIKEERPVRTQTLEKYLLLINDLPGVNVSGLLQPSATQVGAADLVVTLSNKEVEGSYQFDNRGTKYIGPWQHTLSAQVNSLLGLYDRTRVRLFTTTPDSDQLYGGEVMHEEPIGNQGTKFSILLSQTHTHPGDSLTPLNVQGNSDLYEFKLTQPFIRSRSENLAGRLLFDYHDTVTDIIGGNLTTDRLRSLRLGATYNVFDGLDGNNTIDAQLSKGLNIFSPTTTNGTSSRSNVIGDATYLKLNMDVSRLQNLPDDFSLLLAASWQHSWNPLLADEQFGLGGADYARAFDPAELLGDQGLAGKSELRYSENVGEPYLASYQLFTYYDIGRVWLIGGGPGTNPSSTLSSTGVGARLTFTQNLSANFETDFPLVKPSVDQTGYRHDPRFFMSLVARF